MRTISTGDPSTLGTYRKIALAESGDASSRAVKFFDEKIAQAEHGEDEEVLADEREMLVLITQLIFMIEE